MSVLLGVETHDLITRFHAMEPRSRRFADGKGLMSRYSRPKRPDRREMLPICYQNPNRAGTGCTVGEQPDFYSDVADTGNRHAARPPAFAKVETRLCHHC